MTYLRLPYVQQFRDRHGKKRFYYRRAGMKRTMLPGNPGETKFMLAYQAAAAAFEKKTQSPTAPPQSGTFDALAFDYYRSSSFRSLREASQRNYRRIIDRWRGEHGGKKVEHLQSKHVLKHLATRFEQAGPEGANGLRKVLKILCKFAVLNGLRTDDPTLGIRKFKSRGDGFAPWTDDDEAKFLAHWGPGTRERLALYLLLYLGQRRGDTVRLGRQHRVGDKIHITQEKTGAKLRIPIHHKLVQALNELPNDNLTYLTTAYGKPFTAAGFGNWFRDACNKAGLPKRSAHGLRKLISRRLAEVGCSTKQIAAITGHTTLSEVERYTRSADQELLAEQAISKLEG